MSSNRFRKKSQNMLNRSDSTGSSSGRKYLAPTLSDPQARNEKDRYPAKKKTPRPSTQIKNTLPHFSDLNYHHSHFVGHLHLHHHHYNHHMHTMVEQQQQATKVITISNQVTLVYEVHDWWSEQVVCTQSSDEEA